MEKTKVSRIMRDSDMGGKPIEGIVEDASLEVRFSNFYGNKFDLRLKVNDQYYSLCFDFPLRVDRGERVRIWTVYSDSIAKKFGSGVDCALQILDDNRKEKFCYKVSHIYLPL